MPEVREGFESRTGAVVVPQPPALDRAEGKGEVLMGNILAERTPGEDAEWDRNRVEEDPELWDLAVLEQKIAAECEAQGVPMVGSSDGLPLEVEPCQERLRGAGGTELGLACQPLWKRDGFWCQLCDQRVILMRAVEPVPLPDVTGADRETGTGVVNMRSRTRWRERWGG